jgi:hypothetical protein
MNLSTGTTIPQLPTGTIDSLSAVIPVTVNMTGTPVTIRADLRQISQFMGLYGGFTGTYLSTRGYISENGAQLTYGTGTFYRVEAGAAEVNGTVLTWSSPINRSGLTLTSGSIYYSYLYNNAGSASVEESTTAPVWDSSLNYYKKTGDNTRRCIGVLQIETVNRIRMFITKNKGRVVDYWYTDGDATGLQAKVPINSTNSFATGTVWGEVIIENIVPVHAEEALVVAKLVYIGATDEGILGMSPVNMFSGGAANEAPYQARGRTSTANSNIFLGNTWMALFEPQKFYYKIQTQQGNPRAQIEIHGFRFIR